MKVTTIKDWYNDIKNYGKYTEINFESLAKLRNELAYTQQVLEETYNKDTENLVKALKRRIKDYEKELYKL